MVESPCDSGSFEASDFAEAGVAKFEGSRSAVRDSLEALASAGGGVVGKDSLRAGTGGRFESLWVSGAGGVAAVRDREICGRLELELVTS